MAQNGSRAKATFMTRRAICYCSRRRLRRSLIMIWLGRRPRLGEGNKMRDVLRGRWVRGRRPNLLARRGPPPARPHHKHPETPPEFGTQKGTAQKRASAGLPRLQKHACGNSVIQTLSLMGRMGFCILRAAASMVTRSISIPKVRSSRNRSWRWSLEKSVDAMPQWPARPVRPTR